MSYRGKYPTRIKSVSGVKGERGVVSVATNDGRRFRISAKDTGGVMPELGQDIRSFQALDVTPAAAPVDLEYSTPQRVAALKKLAAEDSRIEEIENAGMDEGRFFVHLKPGFDWKQDPFEVTRTQSFGTVAEARQALKNVGASC